MKLTVTDMHTTGEPVRIVTGGYPELRGATILEKRRDALQNHDHIRCALMHEPRGHSEMYGVIPVSPSHPDADLAVLFMHASGYSTMCGHATIAIGRWALETGQVEIREPVTNFVLECPCGPVPVQTEVRDGVIENTRFESVRSYTHALDQKITLDGVGEVCFDIAYGGAYYAFVPAKNLGLDLVKDSLKTVKERALSLTEAVRAQMQIDSPDAADLGFLYGTIVTENDHVSSSITNNHLCYFGEGQLDRSPTGSGVSARLALAYTKSEIALNETCQFAGVSGGTFDARIVREDQANNQQGVIIEVAGRAHRLGQSEFIIEDDDPLTKGFEEPAVASHYWHDERGQ